MAQYLDSLKIAYSSQKRHGRYTLDFFIEPNLAIEADGQYWHNTPEARARDAKRDKYLSEQGITTIRFSDTEIESERESVIAKIQSWLSN